MKAVVLREYGDESVLRYEEVPDPTVSPGRVLIRVSAASVNRGDFGRRAGGSAPDPASLPLIIGWDIAGDIVQVGSSVRGLQVGQRVVARVNRGYAELAAAREDVTVPIPDAVSYDEAASLPVAFLTAWVSLLHTARLAEGETVLVQSAGSGVGMAGVQIAKRVGKAGRVFTTAGSDEKVARGLELGADVAINYTTQDFVQEILRLTQGRGVDVALDMVGGEVFRQSQQALAPGGRLISVGRSSGGAPEVDLELAARKGQEVTVGWVLGERRPPAQAYQDLTQILDLVAAGTLKTVIDRVFPLREAAEAHRYLASRGQFGKVLLRP